MGVAMGCASGANCRNLCICKRDKVSAIGLFDPRICRNFSKKLCLAEMRKVLRANAIKSFAFDDCGDQMATFVKLSVLIPISLIYAPL